MRIASVGCALPAHYFDQATLLAAFRELWGARRVSTKLEKFHASVSVGGRYLALPMEAYRGLASFTACNDAYIRCALDLGEQAVADALHGAGLCARDIDHHFFVVLQNGAWKAKYNLSLITDSYLLLETGDK